MTRFHREGSIPKDELQARLAAGTLKACAMGPCDGRWYVECEPDDDPNEIHAGLPGGDLTFAREFHYGEQILNPVKLTSPGYSKINGSDANDHGTDDGSSSNAE